MKTAYKCIASGMIVAMGAIASTSAYYYQTNNVYSKYDYSYSTTASNYPTFGSYNRAGPSNRTTTFYGRDAYYAYKEATGQYGDRSVANYYSSIPYASNSFAMQAVYNQSTAPSYNPYVSNLNVGGQNGCHYGNNYCNSAVYNENYFLFNGTSYARDIQLAQQKRNALNYGGNNNYGNYYDSYLNNTKSNSYGYSNYNSYNPYNYDNSYNQYNNQYNNTSYNQNNVYRSTSTQNDRCETLRMYGYGSYC